MLECRAALGMESGEISVEQISASSESSANHIASYGRLHFEASSGIAGSWSPAQSNTSQWLQVNLGGRCIKVTGVATQGRNDDSEWVTKYKLQYSNNGANFEYYREQEQTIAKVKIEFPKGFVGNACSPLLGRI